MKLETLNLNEINQRIAELEKQGISYFDHFFFKHVIIGPWDGYIDPTRPFFPNPNQKLKCSRKDYDNAILYHNLYQLKKQKSLR